MSTHNIHFCGEIRKNLSKSLISKAMCLHFLSEDTYRIQSYMYVLTIFGQKVSYSDCMFTLFGQKVVFPRAMCFHFLVRKSLNPFIPEFLKWTLPSLNLDMSIDANGRFL